MSVTKYMVVVAYLLYFADNVFGYRQVIDNGETSLELEYTENGASLQLSRNNEVKLTGRIGYGLNLTDWNSYQDNHRNYYRLIKDDQFFFEIELIEDGFNVSWSSEDLDQTFQDCFDLHSGDVNWYGGPEQYDSQWPIEKLTLSDLTYVTAKSNSASVVERYWLNSKGTYVYVSEKAPLVVDQNNLVNDSVCFIATIREPYVHREKINFNYVLIAKDDPREAQLDAVERFLGKPTGHPNERIIRNPIWTTWAKYKKDINDEIVLSFAQSIADNGFTGQLEIDDKWEGCYGSLAFADEEFGDITSTVSKLKDLGFTVTVWTHPFINVDCDEAATGLENDYFLQAYDGKSNVTNWWNGDAYHIDFTSAEARNWYVGRLKNLQELHGIDSFKFDAGEINFAPQVPILNGDIENSPNLLTTEYVTTCAQFGDLLEVRSAWRTQNLPIFLRMRDKDTTWGSNNGLYTLITTLLQMNIDGYTMVLPDMIGGNGNGNSGGPDAELLIRWTQVNTFMPAMQFSYVPWDITSDEFDSVEIVRTYIQLHQDYADDILLAMNASIVQGIPVNPPIWWVDPTNPDALKCDDQYLLGESILVAPVIESGAVTRDVVIPSGTWKDGNNDDLYEGPQIIKDYPAPINILPYFIKQ